MSELTDSLKGRLLVATTSLREPNFARAVILMVEHNAEGAMGLVLNRATGTRVREAWEHISGEPCGVDQPLYLGGPVEGVLTVLHRETSLAQSIVGQGLCVSSEAESIERLIESGEEPLRCFVGYAGWAPGQIESELGTGSWLPYPADPERVFGDPASVWDQIMMELGATLHLPEQTDALVPPEPGVS